MGEYREKWLREHPPVVLYLSRGDREFLRELAKKTGLSYRELFLKALRDLKSLHEAICKEALRAGLTVTLDLFIEEPEALYTLLVERAEAKGLDVSNLAFFTVSCPICGKPMLFTHKNKECGTEIKPRLLETFKNWAHESCVKRRKQKHDYRSNLSLPLG